MRTGSIELRCSDNCAVIALHGAELTSWRVGNVETIWTPDAAIWDRSSPILFPVVGWCRDARIRVDGQHYPMGVHGFAAHHDFEVIEQSEDKAIFSLRDNDSTRVHFPFAFELRVAYALTPHALSMTLNILNRSDDEMPFACGVHPGFCWPLGPADRQAHRIEFVDHENPYVPVIAPGGLFSEESRAIALDGRRLALKDETFAQEALCFLDARSRSLIYGADKGPRLRASFENFPHLAVWSKPGAPFVCLEAWTGHGDPVGFSGELRDKPSMILLPPGGQSEHRATFELLTTNGR